MLDWYQYIHDRPISDMLLPFTPFLPFSQIITYNKTHTIGRLKSQSDNIISKEDKWTCCFAVIPKNVVIKHSWPRYETIVWYKLYCVKWHQSTETVVFTGNFIRFITAHAGQHIFVNIGLYRYIDQTLILK